MAEETWTLGELEGLAGVNLLDTHLDVAEALLKEPANSAYQGKAH